MSLLQKNPLTMVGAISRCWLLAFRTPAQGARGLVPSPLELMTLGPWAFFNVVVCEIDAMRPRGLPRWMGVRYRHAAYRLYVEYRPPRLATHDGQFPERVGGLFFLRSDADWPLARFAGNYALGSRVMSGLGNALTDFQFHPAAIAIDGNATSGRTAIRIRADGGDAEAIIDPAPPSLPPGSPFASLDDAARFLKYEPAGIALQKDGGVNVVRITRDESKWRCRLVTAVNPCFEFFAGRDVALELVYEMEPIEYRWNRAEVYR